MVNIFILEDFVRSTIITNKLCHPPKDKVKGVVVPPHGSRSPAPAPAAPSPTAAPPPPALAAPAAPIPVAAAAPAPATTALAIAPPAAHLLHQKQPQTHPRDQADQLGVEPSYLVLQF